MARVLIVEDYRPTANMLDAVLAVEGHQATIAGDAEAALHEMQKDGYDLILLDIGLPGGIDGWDLLRIFLRLKDAPPIIVVSGQIDQGDDIKAISLGAVAAVLKPFDPVELCQLIDRVTDKKGRP